MRKIFAVIIVPLVGTHSSATEEADKVFEHMATRLALHYHKSWLYLPAESCLGAAMEWAAEAALSIDKTDYPSVVAESFLLIVRTSHIVTFIHAPTIR